jgi:cardiolipin synthase A/B
MAGWYQIRGLPGWLIVSILLPGCSLRQAKESGTEAPASWPVAFPSEPGVAAFPVSQARFVDSGVAIRSEMLRLVREARHSILVGSFLLNDGPESREILDALAARAREGLEVRVIGDGSSRFVVEKEAFEYLGENGVATAEFNPVKGWRLFIPNLILERDHRKYWIIDGRTVFLGGANLSDSSLIAPERGGNRDLMVRLESPAAAGFLTESFVRTWKESAAALPLDPAALPAAKGGEGDLRFWFFNQENVHGGRSPTGHLFAGLFAAARKSVWLIEPYTFTNAEILGQLRAMTGRGVEVNLVLSTQARAPRFRYASYHGIRDLLEAGVRVWVYDSEISPLHYKCALVDDRLAFVGSANLNHRSYHLSRELNVVFDDPGSVREVKRVVESVRRDCREVFPEEAKRYRSIPFATWWLIMQAAG